jgi:nitroreductase
MASEDLYQAIFKRRSVRKYAGPLDEGAMDKVRDFMSSLKPMYSGIKTELKILSNPEVKGIFKVDAPHFIAFFSEKKEGYLANAGFMLQQMDLFLSANGIGSCWQGGPKPIREARYASELEYVILLAFGRPEEELHRKTSGEFKREPSEKIASVDGFKELIEPARLAPSGMNNQPWYFSSTGKAIDAYSAKSPIVDHMNRISVGIALSHLWLAAEHAGMKVTFMSQESKAADPPRRYSYVATMVFN